MKDPRVLFGIVISIVATAMLFYVVNPREVLAALREANPLACVALFATVVLAMLTKAIRWRLFFPEPEKVRLKGLHEALYIGYMANTVLPLRAGEVVRAFVAAETEHVSKSTTIATVLIEKVLDLGTMALLLFLLGLIFPELPDSARYAAYVSGVGLMLAAGAVIFALAARGMATRMTGWFEEKIPPLKSFGISGLLNAFLDGLAFARNPVTMAWVLLWTLVQWTISAVTVTLALVAVGITGMPPYDQVQPYALLQMTLLVLVATNLSMAIPSAPGYVGVFHGVFVATLALFGVDGDKATAAAVVEHALVFGTFIIGGGYFLVRGEAARAGGRRLGDLVSRARSTADEAH